MNRKVPVYIASTNCLSGVTSWGDQLRVALADHPRYEVRTLYIGPDTAAPADINVRTLDEASLAVRKSTPAILIPNYVWSLFLAAFQPGVHCVGMCHADSVEQYYRPLGWYEPLISKFIAVSSECDERLKAHLGCRAADVRMLPYGVCVPVALRRDYQTKPLRLIYAGRITQPQKRVWDFLPLVEYLLRAKVPFVFDIIGEGDEFAPLKQIMSARVPAADIQFHPRVPHAQMAAKWQTHDIFVQVSEFEGTSVSMLEAMANGAVPVVTAASSGIAGVVLPGENGWIVPVGDMSAMADEIAKLARNPDMLGELGRAAYRTAHAYSMDAYAQNFARILDEVVESGRVDQAKRYGIYSPAHPLMLQQQLIERQQSAINQRGKRPLTRLFRNGLKVWRQDKHDPDPHNDKQAA